MRKISLILIVILLSIYFTACYDAHEIGDYGYVTVMGIEQGASDRYRVTFQIPKFGQSGGGESKGTNKEDEGMNIISVDAPSVISAITIVNTNTSKTINLMHLKAIVISEDLALSGKVVEYIGSLVRYRHIRRTTSVIICKGTAEEFVSAMKPYEGELITQTVEELMENSKTIGFFPKITLDDFYDSLKVPYHALLGTYGAVNKEDKFISGGTTFEGESSNSGDYYAGDIPRKGGQEIELFGSTVFDGSKMVGKLTGLETQALLLVRGELKEAIFSFKDPEAPEMVVNIGFSEFDKREVDIDLNGDRPKIQVKLKMEGDILSIQSGINYENPDKKKILEDACKKYITEEIKKTFDKCKEFKADVFNFGHTAVRQFLTIPEWEEYNWLEKFTNSELKIDINLIIRRTGKIIRTEPIYSSEGKK